MEILRRFRTVPGTAYGTPKEVLGFRTRPRRGKPELIAHRFLKANARNLNGAATWPGSDRFSPPRRRTSGVNRNPQITQKEEVPEPGKGKQGDTSRSGLRFG